MRVRINFILIFLTSLLFSIALWKGFTRGGQDFRVFDTAARLVLTGRWDALYWEGPDRFLYAPGFAILFSPLSLLPVGVTHAVWLALLTSAFIASMRLLSRRLGVFAVCVGILFFMRAIWIDLRYGQVNLLILSASVWALLAWIESTSRSRTLALGWFFLGMAMVSKIYPVALIAFPMAALVSRKTANQEKKRGLIALSASLAGIALVLLLPYIFSGGAGNFLYAEWMDALTRKGFPTDTHNQSLPAFLFRIFSGEPFQALGLGATPLRSPLHFLGHQEIRIIWLFVSLGTAFLFLRSAFRVLRSQPDLHVFLGLALCFLPGHLIWKSYFLLGIPLVAVLVRKGFLKPLIALGLLLTFSSGSFIGFQASAWLEAFSVFFWVHVTVLGLAYFSESVPLSPEA